MIRRLLAVVAAASIVLLPGAAAGLTPTPAPVPVAGSTVIVVLVSDGMALLPFGSAVVPPTACQP